MPLRGIYRLLLSGRGIFYSHIKCPRQLPARVISVGNLTLGGTGKTPCVIAIANEALKRGIRPCILTRGYKGDARGTCLVTRGDGPLVTPSESGDEAFLMAERLRGAMVVKDPDRYRGGRYILDHIKSIITRPESQIVFILDDGFQHIQLKRDIDIVLIDSTVSLSKERLFPAGRLREPISGLSRADIIVLTKTEQAREDILSENREIILRYKPTAPLYYSQYKLGGVVDPSGNIRGDYDLRNKRVYAFAGIADPSHFESMLLSIGADIVKFKTFRDHHIYTINDVDRIMEEARGLDIITTEKDMVKVKGIRQLDNLYALRIEFLIEDGFYNKLF
ncbi:MAG: tetraacyldisaccharide 4'-kinase [Thermodesulfovibrionia bacterium]